MFLPLSLFSFKKIKTTKIYLQSLSCNLVVLELLFAFWEFLTLHEMFCFHKWIQISRSFQHNILMKRLLLENQCNEQIQPTHFSVIYLCQQKFHLKVVKLKFFFAPFKKWYNLIKIFTFCNPKRRDSELWVAPPFLRFQLQSTSQLHPWRFLSRLNLFLLEMIYYKLIITWVFHWLLHY